MRRLRTHMTFEMVRFGCPNSVAILALAVMPFAALALPAERRAVPAVTVAELADAGELTLTAGLANNRFE